MKSIHERSLVTILRQCRCLFVALYPGIHQV